MKKILIDYTADFTYAALTEDGELLELVAEPTGRPSKVGNIYAGLVQAILPSRFAFIDIGEDRNAFLTLDDAKEAGVNLKNGSHVLVQVTKDAAGEKGAAVTTQLSFATGNMVVYKAENGRTGVSHKIEDSAERARLKEAAAGFKPKDYGMILRTDCMGMEAGALAAEFLELSALSEKIYREGNFAKPPSVVLAETAERKILNGFKNFDKVIINRESARAEVSLALKNMGYEILEVREGEPLLSEFEAQIERALAKKLWMKSGGFIIIEQTEACAVIDVNSGKFSGGGAERTQQSAALKINLEACVEIAKQIRLRNLSGMIIVDFIDLREAEDKARLKSAFAAELKKDSASVNLVGMTELGLMQLTRKRTRPPLAECLTRECPACGGSGRVK